ncbi:TetR/AcrR family transcriptional regulator [Qaidamihabitans albus]|uniref:TetR/AcrR family transcriptional regulator n=1 Tax=Qaidamihabitans albus TaxID=2795733 RepID=UPI0018F1EA9C|nr:TetR family transcriptional regulator [Qaidamihabitans albus]
MARTVDAEQAARRREAITLAAARLFATQGFEQTTVADIARSVDLSAGSVFYYFPDKRAVFRAVFERDLPLSRELVARFADAERPVAAVLEFVAELAADARDPSASGLLVELLRQAGRDPELVAVVTRNARIVREGLAGLIARGIADGAVDAALDPDEAAAWIQTIVDAVYLNADPARDPAPALRRTVERYLRPRPEDTGGSDGNEDG